MALLALFAYSFAVGFAAVITPGPVSTAIVTESARRGFAVGPLVTLGHVALEFVMVMLLALGLSAGLSTPLFTSVVGIAGGALLLWMGAAMAWGGYRGRISLPKPGAPSRHLNNWQLLGLGLAATLVNPFWYVWWVTLGTNYMARTEVQVLGFAGLLIFYVGHISCDFLWNSILSGVVGGGRKWISDRLYKLLIVGCGLYLVYLGWAFIASVA
jgi:threonine/homoserine/homoserine lactone efflux protein